MLTITSWWHSQTSILTHKLPHRHEHAYIETTTRTHLHMQVSSPLTPTQSPFPHQRRHPPPHTITGILPHTLSQASSPTHYHRHPPPHTITGILPHTPTLASSPTNLYRHLSLQTCQRSLNLFCFLTLAIISTISLIASRLLFNLEEDFYATDCTQSICKSLLYTKDPQLEMATNRK